MIPGTPTSQSTIRVFGLVPAAGEARRMESETPKQLMPFGDRSMLEHMIDTMLDGGLDGLVVVTRTDIRDELDLAEDPRFVTAINDDPTSEMIDSIRIGLGAATSALDPVSDDGLLVCPGDMPRVGAPVVRRAADAYRARPGSIIVTTHGGRTGHPIVLPFSLRDEIEAVGTGGLHGVRDAHPELIHTVESDSPGVLADVDTPIDYEQMGN